ncbi:hypothetical protein MMC12_008248, partial [Toensbergia leucococca]|nr:hypothetical protein [Toensbergia leucococca]
MTGLFSDDGSPDNTPTKKKVKGKTTLRKPTVQSNDITLAMHDDKTRSILLEEARRQKSDESAPKDCDLINIKHLREVYT